MWSLLGNYDRALKNSYFGYALSVIIAMQTFNKSGVRYSVWMSALFIASGAYIAKKALSGKSYLGIATALLSLVWFAPIISADAFYNINLNFMLAHSTFALSVAVGAFSYLKS